jgi:hypothetical protein
LQNSSTASFSYAKKFPTFQELSSCVAAFAGITHSFTLGDNSRTASVSRLPTEWLRQLFGNTNPDKKVKYSGYLYCPHKSDSGLCPFKVPYKLNASGNWTVLESAVWQHNHDVHPTAPNLVSLSGITQLFSVEDLSVAHSASILSYLDAGLSVKMIRKKFRGKFPGYEVRARVVKSVKARFLHEKYGGDSHQINELSLLPSELARIEHLKSLFQEVCLPSAQSPSHYITLRDKLVHQKQSLNGQSPSEFGPLILPPRSSITTAQSNSMRASAECVPNLSRIASSASSYNRNKRGRIQEAQRRDPTAYNLHKRGVEGAQIQCDCGSWLTNTKRSRHYHSTCHKGHLSWLHSGSASCLATTSTGPDAAVHHVSHDSTERLQNDSQRAAEHHDGHHNGDTPISPHTSAITDSVLDEMHALAPNDPTLLLGANLVRQAAALTDILIERRAHAAESRWTKPPASSDIVFLPRGLAWLDVCVKPADLLPRMTADGMTHLRVNQFCDLCREWQLCKTHEAMASHDNADLTPSHFSAMKATGYCLVECSGAGDCFYHSMMFLAKLHRNDLYIAWGDHDKFRKQSCDNLLVAYYHDVVYVLEYTYIVSRFPTICL